MGPLELFTEGSRLMRAHYPLARFEELQRFNAIAASQPLELSESGDHAVATSRHPAQGFVPILLHREGGLWRIDLVETWKNLFFDSDGNGSLNRVLNEVNIPDDGLAIISGMFNTPGKWFGVGADGNDSFKLKAVKYKVANVPSPAAFPLFAFGLSAASALLRRPRQR